MVMVVVAQVSWQLSSLAKMLGFCDIECFLNILFLCFFLNKANAASLSNMMNIFFDILTKTKSINVQRLLHHVSECKGVTRRDSHQCVDQANQHAVWIRCRPNHREMHLPPILLTHQSLRDQMLEALPFLFGLWM